MPDYQRGKIYKLYSPSKNLIYYGSTIETLAQRLAKHKYEYKKYNEDNSRKYYTSFLVLDCEDYKIELVEEYGCNNKQQLDKKEGEYIKNNECVNNRIAGRTKKEYNIDNADKIKEHKKQYNIENASKIKEQTKQYRINNADKLKEYEQSRKEHKRQYYLKKKAENSI